MSELYCVELEQPKESTYGYGWYVPARRTEMGIKYFLTTRGFVEPDVSDGLAFYFETEQEAYEAMVKYFDDWGEPFPFELSYQKSIQQYESEIMKFE